MFWIVLVSVALRFALLFVAIFAISYVASIPGYHPISSVAGVFALLAYLTIGELTKVFGFLDFGPHLDQEGTRPLTTGD